MRAREVVNATGVWTDDVQELVGERGKFKVRASKGIHLVVPRDRMQLDTGLILRTETSRAVRDPVGPALDRRHHRHRLGARQGAPGGVVDRHRLRARARQRGARAAADARGRRGRLRRAAAAADRRVREHEPALARAHGRRAGAGPGGGRRRQVHDLPGDGARRDRRRRARARPLRPAVGHPRHAAARRRRLPGAVEPARAARGARAGCTSRGSSTCCAATGRGSTTCWRWSRERPELGEPLPGADDYLAVEVRYACTPRGRAAPRRRAHAAHADLDRDLGPRPGGRRARGAADGRGARLGRGDDGRARSRSTARASRPSGARRSSPTTAPPTSSAPRRRTCSRDGRGPGGGFPSLDAGPAERPEDHDPTTSRRAGPARARRTGGLRVTTRRSSPPTTPRSSPTRPTRG